MKSEWAAACLLTGTAGAADTGWRTAYTDWLLSQAPQAAKTARQSAVMLRDLDFDGVPELFWGGTAFGYSELDQARSYQNGRMVPLASKTPAGDPLFVSTSKAPPYVGASLSAQVAGERRPSKRVRIVRKTRGFVRIIPFVPAGGKAF